MKKKQCTKCKEWKQLNKFSPQKGGRYKVKSLCKLCMSICSKEYRRTKAGLIVKIYARQKNSSVHRNHPLPTYTRLELADWAFKQELFNNLYDNYVVSGYQQILVPSVDRIDTNGHYVMSKIQLMTWAENKEKGRIDMRNGIVINGSTPQKPVIQYDKQWNYINDYVSISEAARQTNIFPTGIGGCCRGAQKTSGGFKWKFKNEK